MVIAIILICLVGLFAGAHTPAGSPADVHRASEPRVEAPPASQPSAEPLVACDAAGPRYRDLSIPAISAGADAPIELCR